MCVCVGVPNHRMLLDPLPPLADALASKYGPPPAPDDRGSEDESDGVLHTHSNVCPTECVQVTVCPKDRMPPRTHRHDLTARRPTRRVYATNSRDVLGLAFYSLPSPLRRLGDSTVLVVGRVRRVVGGAYEVRSRGGDVLAHVRDKKTAVVLARMASLDERLDATELCRCVTTLATDPIACAEWLEDVGEESISCACV